MGWYRENRCGKTALIRRSRYLTEQLKKGFLVNYFLIDQAGKNTLYFLVLGNCFDRFKISLRTIFNIPGHGCQLFRRHVFRETESARFRRAGGNKSVVSQNAPFHIEHVIESRAVQDAEQERDRVQNVADAYANQVVAEARGQAAQILEQAEGYRARVVNEAEGEASRFSAVLAEYEKAPEVTRKRLYLETMESVFSGVDIILLDEGAGGGQGVVPYLPLNELRRNTTEGSN